jgi:hypothetical protein
MVRASCSCSCILVSLHARGFPEKDLLVTGIVCGVYSPFLSSFSSSFPLPVLPLHPPQLPHHFPFISFWVQNLCWPVTWHASSEPMWSIQEAIGAASSPCVFVCLRSVFLACYVCTMLLCGGLGSLLVVVWIDDM